MSYQEGAMRFYDLFGEKDDIDFYVKQAKKHGSTALEIGVGTARLAINLARAGINTWGIEQSPHMIKAAEKNIQNEETKTQNRLRIVQANAIDFNLKQKFDLIYFPSCSFDHILESEDQMKSLRNFKRHLNPDGGYVFDLYIQNDQSIDKGWFVQKKECSPDQLVVRSGHYSTDFNKHIMSLNMWYEVVEKGRITERFFETSQVYIHHPEEVRLLLDTAGFNIVSEYGNHSEKPYRDGDQIIVFVTKPKRKL